MSLQLSFIGFGEAGRAFAPAVVRSGAVVRACDVLSEEGGYQNAFTKNGVIGSNSYADTLRDAELILSLVTADQSLVAAEAAASNIPNGAVYCDMNSVAPDTKKQAADMIENAGGHYVDVAIMAPVHPKRESVPLLLSGPVAPKSAERLRAAGFANCRVVGTEIGAASMIKMIRSIVIKGQEALTAEMILAARNAKVEEEVVNSLGSDWQEKVAYHLERMTTHGERRAVEMEEVAKTLKALGIDPLMTCGTITRQRRMAEGEIS